ncbi:MAG TPA: ABC transporter permease [Vicinamibacterales bacterium]
MKRSLRSWLWRVPLDREVDEELALHIELRTRELVERGLDPKAAREIVLSRIGDLGKLKRTCMDLGRKREREMRLTRFIEEFRDDVRLSIRQLVKAPGFTIVATITLALGIGVNSAIFALVDATLLRPLPFHEPDRLVAVWERTDQTTRGLASPLNVTDWNQRTRTFELISGFVPGMGAMVTSGNDGTAETVSRQWVLAGTFDVLAVKPIAGRMFRSDDNDKQKNMVVLSEGYWRTRYGGDASIVGRDVRFDGEPYTVVGVAPKEFTLLGDTAMWGLRWIPNRPQLRAVYGFQGVGRLKPGVTLEQAQADIATVASGLANEFPQSNKGRTVYLEPLHDALIGRELRTTSLLFLGVVGFVLLICCANVANLLLARATARSRELAIRSAIGARRGRIVRQLLTESLVLAVIGGAFGVAVGAAILKVAPSVLPAGLLPGMVTIAFDARVLAFCGIAAVATGVLFGLAPAWQATGVSSVPVLAGEGRASTGRGGRIRRLLVVAEVATAVLLLFGGGLLLRSLMAVERVDRGYHTDGAVTMMVDPLGSTYPTPERLLQFFDDVDREVRAIPGVRNVAYTSTLPLGASDLGPTSFEIVGDPPAANGQRSPASFQLVSHTYFDTLRIPVVTGRGFTDRDTLDKPPVCVVSEAFVRTYLGGRSPIGLQLAMRPSEIPQAKPDIREIVGVVGQVNDRPDEIDAVAQVYVPFEQRPIDDIYLVAAPQSPGMAGLAASVRAAIDRVDTAKLVSVHMIQTLDDIAWDATGRYRFRAVLVMTFATLALMLAMVGVFGVLGYAVQQRSREFGVRVALGATGRNVLALVLGSAGRLILAGVAIGLALAVASARTISTFLFGVQPIDPITFVLVPLVLIATTAIAVAAPAWRAARIDPVEAFRSE